MVLVDPPNGERMSKSLKLKGPFRLTHWDQMFSFRLPDLVKQKYEGAHKEQVSALCDKLSEETKVTNALKRFGEGTNCRTQAQTDPDRTMASPQWGSGGDRPWNWNKRLHLAAVSVSDFESANQPFGFEFSSFVFQ